MHASRIKAAVRWALVTLFGGVGLWIICRGVGSAVRSLRVLDLVPYLFGASLFLLPAILILRRRYNVIVRVCAFVVCVMVWAELSSLPERLGFRIDLPADGHWSGFLLLALYLVVSIFVPLWVSVRLYQFITCLYSHWFETDGAPSAAAPGGENVH